MGLGAIMAMVRQAANMDDGELFGEGNMSFTGTDHLKPSGGPRILMKAVVFGENGRQQERPPDRKSVV